MNWKNNFSRPDYFSLIKKNHFLISSKLNNKKIFYEVINKKLNIIFDKNNDFFLIYKKNDEVFLIDKVKNKIFLKTKDKLKEIFFFREKLIFHDGYFCNKKNLIYLTESKTKSIFILNFLTKKLKRKKVIFKKKIISPFAISCDDRFVYISDSKTNTLFILSFKFVIIKSIFSFGKNNEFSFRNVNKILTTNNNIIINDQYNYRLLFFNKNFSFINSIGSKGNGKNRFDLISNIIKQKKNIFICDYNNDRIIKLNSGKNIIKRISKDEILSRPVFFILKNKKLYVCDRDNNSIKIFSTNLKFEKKIRFNRSIFRPTSLDFITIDKKKHFVILEREKNKRNMIKIFEKNNLKNKKLINSNSAQCMRVIKNDIWLSDTNNRRILILNHKLEKKYEINLLKISSNKKIQCKYFFCDNKKNIYFSDFEKGVVFKIDLKGKILSKNLIHNANKLKNLRAVYCIKNKLILLTKNKNPIWKYDTKSKKLKNIVLKNTVLKNPTDILYDKHKNQYLICDKENDRIISVNYNLDKSILSS